MTNLGPQWDEKQNKKLKKAYKIKEMIILEINERKGIENMFSINIDNIDNQPV